MLARYTEPEPDQAILLQQMKLHLPASRHRGSLRQMFLPQHDRPSCRWYGAGGEKMALIVVPNRPMECLMPKPNDLSRSLVALDQDSTLIAVIELGLASWLVAGVVPGVDRQPLKKLTADPNQLAVMLRRWKEQAEKAGRTIERVTVAFEAGRDGFWLARWLRARGIEAHVIHPSSVPVPA